MCEYLTWIPVQGLEEEDDELYLEPVKGLRLEHTFHALSGVRTVGAVVARKDGV